MKIKKTYLELMAFNKVAEDYLIVNKDAKTKLSVSIENIFKQLKPIFEDYNEKVDELRLNNCATSKETGILIFDERGSYTFKPEDYKKLKNEIKKLQLQEVELHARITPENDTLKGTLSELQLEVFSEIVITKEECLEP